jgi:DNA-binding LacI/PurR family transcriptional regulator
VSFARISNDHHDRSVSIRDVAEAAGVSIATVSRVLHDSPVVAPTTAAKVREVIRNLKYIPNPLAQALSSGETHVIGLALPRFHGEFMTWLLHGADEEATSLGYHLMMTTIGRGMDGKARPRIVGSELIDAMLVVMTEAEDPLAEDILAAGLPTVVLDTDMSARGLDSVILDNEKGTREAVEHLLRWVEPKNLYFVGGPRGNFDTINRTRAFTSALAATGWSVTPDQVTMGDYSLDWGKEWAIRMLRHKLLAGSAIRSFPAWFVRASPRSLSQWPTWAPPRSACWCGASRTRTPTCCVRACLHG